MQIVELGHVCKDHNIIDGVSYEAAGGPPMFMEKIFRQLPDCSFIIAAPYGKNFVPYTKGISFYPDEPQGDITLLYENIVTEGKRIQKCFYSEQAFPIPFDQTLIEFVSTADVICLAPLTPNFAPEYVRQISRYRKTGSITVLLPQGYYRKFDSLGNVKVREFEEANLIVPYMDVIIVSQEDHSDMLSIANKWSSQFSKIVAVTQAKNGAMVFEKGIKVSVPTIPVPVDEIVSSIGAGDAFAAGFMYKYNLNHNATDAAAFANSIARQCLFCKPDDIHIRSVY
jgi:sugar/nucleoside kinase (ribokinase family)